jgi:protein SCO1
MPGLVPGTHVVQHARMTRFLGCLVLALVLVCAPAAFAQAPSPAPPVAAGGPFTLTAADGTVVTDQTYRGKWLLIYFGYTHCPDVCPTTLSEMAAALDELGPRAGQVQAIFITLDPRRDTAEIITEYVKAFDARIVGLTGTPQQVGAAARAYQVFYERVDRDDGDYLIDHTSYLYVVGPDGRFVIAWPSDRRGEEMARDLDGLMGRR